MEVVTFEGSVVFSGSAVLFMVSVLLVVSSHIEIVVVSMLSALA
jgi:hypothetical protein